MIKNTEQGVVFQKSEEANEAGSGLLNLRGLRTIQLKLPISLWVMGAGIQEEGWR